MHETSSAFLLVDVGRCFMDVGPRFFLCALFIPASSEKSSGLDAQMRWYASDSTMSMIFSGTFNEKNQLILASRIGWLVARGFVRLLTCALWIAMLLYALSLRGTFFATT